MFCTPNLPNFFVLNKKVVGHDVHVRYAHATIYKPLALSNLSVIVNVRAQTQHVWVYNLSHARFFTIGPLVVSLLPEYNECFFFTVLKSSPF